MDLMEVAVMYGAHKSHAVVMTDLTASLLNDIQELHKISSRECRLDAEKMRLRALHEGTSFFTKTLPGLAKSLDKALTGSQFNTTSFKLRRGTKLPLFLHGLFKLVLDEDGFVLPRPDVLAVRSIRQVGFMFYKFNLPYPEATTARYVDEYFSDDESLSLSDSMLTNSTIFYAQEVLDEVLKDFSFSLCVPKNGPGSVANRKSPWERFRPYTFYEELDRLRPYPDMYFYNDRHLFDSFDVYRDLEIAEDSVVQLIAVPKDSRGPRLISSEPSEKMTYQQFLKGILYPYIETHRITRGQVNFTDQTINGRLALEGSIEGVWATLDLSKASDLLSLELVDALFESTPIHEFLMGARSTHVRYRNRTHRLRKYGPMGNALTFPVQALSFYSIIVGSLIADGVPKKIAHKSVFVYGDDIIVPTEHVHLAIDSLQACGLRINTEKSCFSGCFRESCGVDACLGVDVTPVKVKETFQKQRVTSLRSWVSYSNEFFWRGYWNLSREVLKTTEQGKFLPFVTTDSPLIGVETWTLDHAMRLNKRRRKWSQDYQAYQIRGQAIVAKTKKPVYPGWEHMLNWAWNGTESADIPFSTNTFAVRYAAQRKHTVVVEHFV